MKAAPERETRLMAHCPTANHDSYSFTPGDVIIPPEGDEGASSESGPNQIVKP